jgi:tungstate transport system ATP-binding protein
MPLIETVELCQKYGGRDILKNINLEVERGEVLALIGPTGAGKTTLLRLIDLLEMPSSGRIYFEGRDATESRKVRLQVRRRMAFVIQKPVVFNSSIYDNIACGLRWRGEEKNSIRQKVSNILEMIDLSAYKNRNARTLSGGEAQRVAIARAIVTEPEVLLLDEPTANLDPLSVAKIEELITSIIHQYATTIIMATHDMAQGQRLAKRIGVLIDGEIVQAGDPREVFTLPQNREVAEFVGVDNMIDGIIVASEEGIVAIDAGGNKIIEAISTYLVGGEVCACVRAENITLTLVKTTSSARNSFLGQITGVVSLGPLSRIEIDCGFRLVALVTRRSAEELGLEKGKQVYATFKATAVHVLKKN